MIAAAAQHAAPMADLTGEGARLSAQLLALLRDPLLFDLALDQALERLARSVRTALELPRVSVWISSADQTAFVAIAIADDDGRARLVGEFAAQPFRAYLRGLEQTRALAALNAHDHPLTTSFRSHYLEPLGLKAMIDTPIRGPEGLIGMLCAESRVELASMTMAKLAFLGAVGDLCARMYAAQQKRVLERIGRLREALADADGLDRHALGLIEPWLPEHYSLALITAAGDVVAVGPLAEALTEADPNRLLFLARRKTLRLDSLPDLLARAGEAQGRVVALCEQRPLGSTLALLISTYPTTVRRDQAEAHVLIAEALDLLLGRLQAGAQVDGMERQWRGVLDLLPCVIFEIAGSGELRYANHQAQARLGLSAERPDALLALLDDQGRHALRGGVEQAGSSFGSRTAEQRLKLYGHGELRFGIRALDPHGGGGYLFSADLTPAESEDVNSDRLTGLATRGRFERELEQALAGPHAAHLVLVDLDRFGLVNRAGGRAAGNELLRQFSQRLRHLLGPETPLARVGDDEFAFLIDSANAEATIQAVLQCAREHGYRSAREAFHVSASVGCVDLAALGDSVDLALEAVELALIAAKEQGGDRAVHYRAGDRVLVARRALERQLARLTRTLERGSIELHGQPIVDLGSGDVAHHEVLCRLRDEQGLVSPQDFIPIAEQYGLIQRLDLLVLSRAATWLADHPQAELSVNVSGLSIGGADFCSEVEQLIAHNPQISRRLNLEITETSAIANPVNARATMDRLREYGVRFSLDDFGAGYSAFAQLRVIGVDYLKIDGSLIRLIESDSLSVAIVESIVRIARSLGQKTVAEQVESEAQARVLRDLGVDYGQGFAFGAPAPMDMQ